ncbi:MAG TPA: efflux RND transporter periplasmic adaptor subunit [Candidatus Limnocylindrales bacterium]|nr:efflux RND transporter periplasmic adaptor subunit [Candidatus Limnocylindrales bacterium]
MHRPPPIVRLVVLLVVLGVVGAATWYYLDQQRQDSGQLTASGTIEADAVTISPQVPGRVVEVNADEGDSVTAGDPIVVLDGAMLQAQRAQAQAAIDAADASLAAAQQGATAVQQNVVTAQAGVAAAQANLDLLEAGASAEQLAIAQANVDAAQVAVADLEATYDDMSKAVRDSAAGQEIKLRRDVARANLQTALAQQRLTQAGARPEQLAAARAQLDAANAQVGAAQAQADTAAKQADAAAAQAAAARAALAVLDSQIAQLTISAPIDGVVLTRSIEPGEYAGPGAALLVVGNLGALTITVYVPEDRLSEVSLGETAEVRIDSGETSSGTVAHIADQAEFTPRNVQTPEGRRSTVFAIKLAVDNPDGRLKPGMPADVAF